MKFTHRKFSHLTACVLIAGTALFTSCKKKEDATPSAPSEQAQQTSDNGDVKSESDQLNSDVNDYLNASSLKGGRVGQAEDGKVFCGCSVDSSQIQQKILTLNFDGTTPCSANPRRTRAGKLVLQLITGNRWSEVGAILQITMVDFKVTRLSDNKSITFNGVKTLKHATGTFLGLVLQTDSVTYVERGNNITARLDNNATHTFSVRRTTVWRVVPIQGNAQVKFRAKADTSYGGIADVDTWGTNRYGTTFTSAISEQLQSNTYCGLGQPSAGKVDYRSENNLISLTLGVDQSGNHDTRDCGYGYKISWALANGQTGQQVVSY